MYWSFRKLHYDILVPKLDKNIYSLSPEEAKQYFDWCMSKLPERVEYLKKVCAKEMHISESRLDYSPESLVLLWKWFLRRAKTEPISKEEKENNEKSIFVNLPKHKLTLETEYILRDIGMYFGETFIKNNPNLYWSFRTKPHRDVFVNRPIIMGFVDMTTGKPYYADVDPVHLAGVQAVGILKHNAKDTDLLRIYNIWIEKR